ncbi:MAG: nitroreductase [Solobacterium sp.]|nr:nitroreductase [Solobacterium sp.]MBR2726658.1 nitroreductase [Solobacterium sp.]
MNVLEAIRTRRSVRKYEDKPISLELLNRIAEAGVWAASGMNSQGAIVLIVTDKEIRDELSKLNADVMGTDNDPFYGAPYVLVALAPKDNPIHVYDGSLVMGNMMLAAHELGLGSCWIHRAKEVFDTKKGREILKKAGVEGEYEGIGNLIVGYAAETPADKERKPGRIYHI